MMTNLMLTKYSNSKKLVKEKYINPEHAHLRTTVLRKEKWWINLFNKLFHGKYNPSAMHL